MRKYYVKMAAAKEGGEYGPGCPVWYRSSKDIGWWPCMVSRVCEESGEGRSIDLRALGDDHEYGWVETDSPNLLPFTCPKCRSMVQEQLKRFQRRRLVTCLGHFVAAVRQALEHFPSFQLDVGLPRGGEFPTLTTPPARDVRAVLNDSDVFTPSSCSRDRRGNSASRSLRPRRRPPPTTTPLECHSVPLRTTERPRSDDVLVRSTRGSARKKRRNGGQSPYSAQQPQFELREAEEESGNDTELPIPVRRKLDMEESIGNEGTAIPDILTACEPVRCTSGDVSDVGERGCEVENGERGEEGRCEGATESEASGGECGGFVGSHSLDGTQGLGTEGDETSASEEVEDRRKGGEEALLKIEREKEMQKEREMEKSATEEEEESDSSEDDDLPVYHTKTSTAVIVNELKAGDHIWSKFGTFPHWPALVVKVQPAKNMTKARAKIVYFGDNPSFSPVTIRHKSRKNLARYVRGNQQFEQFMRAGRECGLHAYYFLQSVREAEAFIAAKCNKELTGSALEMFRQICDRRPASMIPPISLLDRSLSFQHNEPPTVSAFGYPLNRNLVDREEGEGEEEEGESESSDSESEQEDPIYTLDKILQHFTRLKPTLIGIMSGANPSEYHRVFTSGSAKEKHKLTICGKYGPCKKWKTAKKMALIQHLQKMAEDSFSINCPLFRYAGDVLLPEAMIRTISHFEGVSEHEAQSQL